MENRLIVLVVCEMRHVNPGPAEEIISILNSANDMTIATVREDGHPQAKTVSYVNDGLIPASSDSQMW